MAYAALDASRIARAAKAALTTLEQTGDAGETHQRKTIMVERIHALAAAAEQSDNLGPGQITLTSEEFWLISRNW